MESGKESSEYRVTAVVIVIGTVLDAIGIILGTLSDAGFITAAWLSIVLVIIGSLLIVAKALGYTRSRTLLKLAEIQPRGAQVTVFKKEKDKPIG